jgi:BirA family transcriptional regulator, biotin operon repressor / biotin---[acetyl-CoA-carboxylase] ligase
MPPFGRPHRHITLTDSTNERARELAQSGAPGGTVVTASEQSAGRGRHERTWTAPAGKALLYSAILRPLDEGHGLLPLAVPLAVCEAVEAVAPVRCQVKWPNDVWIEQRKVAGVLIEARPPGWAVIGIGINIAIEPEEFPPDLRWPAASVGHGVTVKAALGALNDALSARVESPAGDVLDSFRERDALAGREVSWEGAGEGTGTARGIDERGNLMVETEPGERVTLGSGEVTLRARNL